MAISELQDQIKQLDDADFQTLLAWVVTPERERRTARLETTRSTRTLEEALNPTPTSPR